MQIADRTGLRHEVRWMPPVDVNFSFHISNKEDLSCYNEVSQAGA
jgi:hypothetical protein